MGNKNQQFIPSQLISEYFKIQSSVIASLLSFFFIKEIVASDFFVYRYFVCVYVCWVCCILISLWIFSF